MTSDEKKPGVNPSTSEKEEPGVNPSTSEERKLLVDRSTSIDRVLPEGDVPFDRYSENSDESQLSKPQTQEVGIPPEIGRGPNWNAAKQHLYQYLPYLMNENNGGTQYEINVHHETDETLKDGRLARRMDRELSRTTQTLSPQITLSCMPDWLVRGLTRVTLTWPDYSIGLCICGFGVLFMIFLVALILLDREQLVNQ